MESTHVTPRREPWNRGKLVGQKAPLKLKDIWAIRVRPQMHERLRELALLNLGIDSKLRACWFEIGKLPFPEPRRQVSARWYTPVRIAEQTEV